MNLLLDECMPRDLSKSFPEHTCWTVSKAGFAGKRNGDLLTLAEQAGFDVLLTVDRGLPYQQNFESRKLAVLIVQAPSNRLKDLLPHVPRCLEALRSLQAGQVVRVGAPSP
jgi:hypothetical protein